MRRFGLVGGTLAVVGLLLAGLTGCSDSPGSSTDAQGTQETNAAAMRVWRDLAQCVSTNGGPVLADPRFEPSGKLVFPPGAEAALRAAPSTVNRCQDILNRLPPEAQGEGAAPVGNIEELTKFARCMREHGVSDFPDPRSDGRFPLAGTSIERGKTPVLLRATDACRSVNPDPKGGFVGTD